VHGVKLELRKERQHQRRKAAPANEWPKGPNQLLPTFATKSAKSRHQFDFDGEDSRTL